MTALVRQRMAAAPAAFFRDDKGDKLPCALIAAELHRPYHDLCARLASLVEDASADHSHTRKGEIDSFTVCPSPSRSGLPTSPTRRCPYASVS
jgi:hypothetical protein